MWCIRCGLNARRLTLVTERIELDFFVCRCVRVAKGRSLLGCLLCDLLHLDLLREAHNGLPLSALNLRVVIAVFSREHATRLRQSAHRSACKEPTRSRAIVLCSQDELVPQEGGSVRPVAHAAGHVGYPVRERLGYRVDQVVEQTEEQQTHREDLPVDARATERLARRRRLAEVAVEAGGLVLLAIVPLHLERAIPLVDRQHELRVAVETPVRTVLVLVEQSGHRLGRKRQQ